MRVAGSVVDAQLADTASDEFAITEIARHQTIGPRRDFASRPCDRSAIPTNLQKRPGRKPSYNDAAPSPMDRNLSYITISQAELWGNRIAEVKEIRNPPATPPSPPSRPGSVTPGGSLIPQCSALLDRCEFDEPPMAELSCSAGSRDLSVRYPNSSALFACSTRSTQPRYAPGRIAQRPFARIDIGVGEPQPLLGDQPDLVGRADHMQRQRRQVPAAQHRMPKYTPRKIILN